MTRRNLILAALACATMALAVSVGGADLRGGAPLAAGATFLPLAGTTGATPTPRTAPTATPNPGAGQNYNLRVGPGYTDVSPKALVRTGGNRLYIAASTCDEYPCTDASQTLRMYRADSTGVPTGFTLVDQAHAPAGVSQWAIAIDGGDSIHVVWNDRPADGASLARLRYTTFATATDTWGGSVETIEAALGVSLESGGQGMQSVALALDAGGLPHVVYLKGGGPERRVFHRSRGTGGWSAATQLDDAVVYSNNQKAWHPNLAFDPGGRLLVVWLRGSFNTDNDGTLFGRVRGAGGAWGGAVNVSGVNAARVTIDQSTSLLVTSDGRYHITWITAPDDYIRYQYSDDGGQTWRGNHPGGGVQATHNPSLGYAAGRLRIYGHGAPAGSPDGHGDNLYCFEGAGGPAAWGPWTLLVTGKDYDSSVNVRWSFYFHAFPNTIDLAYWHNGYPNILYAGSEVKRP